MILAAIGFCMITILVLALGWVNDNPILMLPYK